MHNSKGVYILLNKKSKSLRGGQVLKLEGYITVKEFRAIYRISTEKAYELVKLRNFPSIKVGKRYYVNKDKAYEWISSQSKI